jgi:hypothetical protein
MTPVAGGEAIVKPVTMMVMASVAVALAESVTFAVNVTGPTVVGVPVMAPVELFRLRPAGKLPTEIE